MTTDRKLKQLSNRLRQMTARISALEQKLAEGVSVNCNRPKIRTIQRVVCEHYGLLPSMMTSVRKSAHVATPRQIAMSLAYTLTPHGVEDVGRCFSRDHGTVSWAVKVVNARCQTSPSFAADFAVVKAKVEEALANDSALHFAKSKSA